MPPGFSPGTVIKAIVPNGVSIQNWSDPVKVMVVTAPMILPSWANELHQSNEGHLVEEVWSPWSGVYNAVQWFTRFYPSQVVEGEITDAGGFDFRYVYMDRLYGITAP